MDEFNNLETTKAQFSLMYLNISSLQYHFEEPDDILNTSQTNSSVVGMTESCFKKGISSLSNINLQNYKTEHTPKESEKGGSLQYISSDLNYKVPNDLKMCKSQELVSFFIEIMSKGKEKNTIGCIYKRPKLPIE